MLSRTNILWDGKRRKNKGVVLVDDHDLMRTGLRMIDKTPMGKFGDPDMIAQGAIYLGSDESSFSTGSELVIDGGYNAQ